MKFSNQAQLVQCRRPPLNGKKCNVFVKEFLRVNVFTVNIVDREAQSGW